MSMFVCVVMLLMITESLAQAQSHPYEMLYFDDHHDVFAAVKTNRILPLTTIINKVSKLYSGKILDIAPHKLGTGYIYRITLLSDNSTVQHLWVNAADGTLLSSRSGR